MLYDPAALIVELHCKGEKTHNTTKKNLRLRRRAQMKLAFGVSVCRRGERDECDSCHPARQLSASPTLDRMMGSERRSSSVSLINPLSRLPCERAVRGDGPNAAAKALKRNIVRCRKLI